MGRFYTILGFLDAYLFNRVLVFYIRFLTGARQLNLFQIVLIFGLCVFQTYLITYTVRDAIVSHDEKKSALWNDGRDYATWRTGRSKRDSFVKAQFGQAFFTLFLCLFSHLITWTSVIKVFESPLSDTLSKYGFFTLWAGGSSIYLELPAYLVLVFRLFFRPYRSYYENLWD